MTEKAILQFLKICIAFSCPEDLQKNKMSNKSLFIDTNLTATSLSGLGAVDNLPIENTIGEAKGTRGKNRKICKQKW